MITTIIFDLGGVLIDWNPEYLYTKVFDNEEEMKSFLATVCTPDWNEEQDGGRSIKEATETLAKQYPEHEQNIEAYYSRWPEMLRGPIDGTVEILHKLRQSSRYKLYALTNWSTETFPIARERYKFLAWFDGIVVSGEEKMRKPDPAFYKLLFEKYGVDVAEALFIDDNVRNVAAARKLGIDSIVFTTPDELIRELAVRNIVLNQQ